MKHFTLNIQGRIHTISTPWVMGIINVTTDSFHSDSRVSGTNAAQERASEMLKNGARIIDLGAYSSRPGAPAVELSEEWNRLEQAIPVVLKAIAAHNKAHPKREAFLSIDTCTAEIARRSIAAGAHIINDISAGDADPEMMATVAELQCPYILMHMQGNPQNMQDNPNYTNVVEEVFGYLSAKVAALAKLGVHNSIIDVGFGFGKTVEHNYQLLAALETFNQLERPVLTGVSRKSMIYKPLQTTPEHALNGTTALHAWALKSGSKILRVHDVKEAVECINLYQLLEG